MNTKILEKLISFDTESSKSNLLLINYCKKIFKKANYNVKVWGKGEKANLFAYKGKLSAKKIILSAHTDTVPAGEGWKDNPLILRKFQNKLSGLGVADMKIFIAIMLDFAQKSSLPNLAFLLTYNEESNFEGAKLVEEKILRKNDFLIIGEPTEGRVVFDAKGLVVYSLRLIGKGGHGSEPGLGLSSIVDASKFILQLEKSFTELAKNYKIDIFSNPLSTMNIGRISGGEAINIIPAKTEIGFEIRTTDKKVENLFEKEVKKLFRSLRCKAILSKGLSIKSFSASEMMRKIVGAAALKRSKGVSYCTEANIFGNLCPNVVIFGPGSIAQAHQPNESIPISEVVKYEKDLTKIIDMLYCG